MTLPSQLNEIETACFSQCKSLLEIVFNNNLARIGYNSFSGCEALENVDLSATKVSYIEQSFYGCSNIQTLALPKTLETIWGTCFTSTKLTEINCQATTPPTLSNTDNTFRYDYIKNTCKLIVPKNTVSLYKAAAGWKKFYNITDNSLDYNNITNEDDLQRALDEIAEQKPSAPVEVKIAESGIVLSHGIRANAYCKAIVTGGNISVKEGFGDDALFYVNNSTYLSFNNITIDFANVKNRPSCFYVSESGILEITESVEYKNISTNTIKEWLSTDAFYTNYGNMILRGGDASGIEGSVISNCGIVDMRGDIFRYGINLYNYYERIKNGGLNKLGTIRLLSSIPETVLWTFSGNWDEYPMETPFIESSESYTLQASDYWQMRFTGLPTAECDGRTQYYDGSTHNIKLKDFSSLQCLLDNSGEEVDVPCEGVDADKNVNLDLQTLLDGGGCNDSETEHPLIRLPGGCVFFPEMPVMTLEPTIVRDVTFDSYSSGHRVYVRREVTFERNVKARNFLVFTIVEKGGHLIWQNALTENVLYPLYNDGGVVDIVNGKMDGIVYNQAEGKMSMSGDVTANVIENSGTLVMEGNVKLSEIRLNSKSRISLTSKLTSKWVVDLTGDGTAEYESSQVIVEGYGDYKITAEDFDNLECQIPEGYGVVLDTAHNAIILLNSEQLSGVKGVRIADSDDGNFYTLEGVKVNPPVKKGFYIKNGKKFVVK